MTAEIAIMNRSAVALAADSAVTLQIGQSTKVYNTVNKLFSLSYSAPIGVMIWGNAEICGIPWEVVIKEFRRTLGAAEYQYLNDYADALFDFLASSEFFSVELQSSEVRQLAAQLFQHILVDRFLPVVHQQFEQAGEISVSAIEEFITTAIETEQQVINDLPYISGFDGSHLERILSEHRSTLDQVIELIFEQLPITSTMLNKLHQLFATAALKQYRLGPSSGLVLAGFGRNEVFPGLISIEISSYVLGQPRVLAREDHAITHESEAMIVPFAQREMVHLFMEGIDPQFRDTVLRALENLKTPISAVITDVLKSPHNDEIQSQNISEKINTAISGAVQHIHNQILEYSTQQHVEPIIRAVAALPKDELGAMAESLVSLTSFKRRVTLDPETVGGEIDVAVISKGDGLIWLQRKHYFDSERNPQFMRRYHAQ